MKNLTKLAMFGIVAAMCLACGSEGNKKCKRASSPRKCKKCSAFVETTVNVNHIS